MRAIPTPPRRPVRRRAEPRRRHGRRRGRRHTGAAPRGAQTSAAAARRHHRTVIFDSPAARVYFFARRKGYHGFGGHFDIYTCVRYAMFEMERGESGLGWKLGGTLGGAGGFNQKFYFG